MAALVQQGGQFNGQGGNSISSPTTDTNHFGAGGNLTTTAGNFLVAICSGLNGTSAASSVTVSGASFGTWQQAGSIYTSGNYWFSCWYVANCNAVSPATNISVSIAFTGPQNVHYSFAIFEFSGVATSSPFDTSSAGATGSVSTPNCGSITTAQQDLIIANATSGGSAAQTAGSGYTLAWSNYDGVTETNSYEYGTLNAGAQTPAFGSLSTPTWVAKAWAFSALNVPTVVTGGTVNILPTTATANGNITVTGGVNSDHRGVVYDTSSHGAPGNVAPGSSGYASNVDESGSFGTGAFTESLTGLTQNTTYYVRAYAHNSAGYSYGSETSFITTIPVVLSNLSFKFSGLAW